MDVANKEQSEREEEWEAYAEGLKRAIGKLEQKL